MGLEVEVHQTTHIIVKKEQYKFNCSTILIWLKMLGCCNKVTPGKFIMAQSSKMAQSSTNFYQLARFVFAGGNINA